MTDNKNLDNSRASASSDSVKAADFGGYGLEDLRYRRAMVGMRKEFAKAKFVRNASHLRKNNALTGKPSASKLSGLVNVGSVAGKVLGGLSVVDYALMAFSAATTVRKVLRFFKR